MSRAGSEQLRNLLAVTDAALARLDVEDLLSELLDRIRSVLDADTAAHRPTSHAPSRLAHRDVTRHGRRLCRSRRGRDPSVR